MAGLSFSSKNPVERGRLRGTDGQEAGHEPAVCSCSPEGQLYPGLHQLRGGSREREGTAPLCSALVRPHLDHRVQPGAPSTGGKQTVGAGPEEATKKLRGLEHLSCEERLREMGLFSLEKRRLKGDLAVAFQCLKGAYKQVGDRLFTQSDRDRTRANSIKVKEGGFRSDVRKKIFTQRAVKPWHSCSESCGCPIPGDAGGRHPEENPAGWNWMISNVPSNLSHSMII